MDQKTPKNRSIVRKIVIGLAVIVAIPVIIVVGFYANMIWQFSNPKPYRVPEKTVRENLKRDELRGIAFEVDPTDQIVEAYSTDGIAPVHYLQIQMTSDRVAALRSALGASSKVTEKFNDVARGVSRVEASKVCKRFQSSRLPSWWTVCQADAGSNEHWIIERKQGDVKTTISLRDKSDSVFISAFYPYPLHPDR